MLFKVVLVVFLISRIERCCTQEENTVKFWSDIGQSILKEQLKVDMGQKESLKRAKNVVLVMGSGMSVVTLKIAEIYQKQNLKSEKRFFVENMPVTGFAQTECFTKQCLGTAFSINKQTQNINVVQHNSSYTSMDDVESLAQWALSSGKDVGIVTTNSLTFESIAPMFSERSSIGWESDVDVPNAQREGQTCQDIACQLLLRNPGNQIKVILGGGKENFVPKTTKTFLDHTGRREDSRNLIDNWIDDKKRRNSTFKYVEDKESLLSVGNDTEYLLGMFDSKHMNFAMIANRNQSPTIEEMVGAALKIVSKNKNGYFLFVFGGRIDDAHRTNRARLALDETVQLSSAVEAVINFSDEKDTLLVVTSDHGSTMTMSGYPERNQNVLKQMIGYTASISIVSYGNGLGYWSKNDGSDITEDPQFRYVSSAPLAVGTQGAEDVAVFARGPWQELFVGSYNLDLMPHIIGYAACIGPGVHSCKASSAVGVLSFKWPHAVVSVVIFNLFIKRLLCY